ncbi:hypothetical protein DS742_18210 [Lacrimispora amygdalina]|uniref:DUF7666 domain-containing protein n=1 Tax=Lacrimispora amygdalina TaxID=253257 RepID=A0A3E2N8Z9_9FIRM|nr:hypothetical protein [Clostridium indicum]RFZ77487.1 hypothetical protein DS742_18210 [Clostridium indicum]
MIAYKGFSPGLVCRGYQFHMGLNVTDMANCRDNGFHCAEDPLDCLTYYSDMEDSEYYIVEAGGDIDEDDLDSKIACTHLNILKRLTEEEFFLHSLAYMVDHPKRRWNSKVQKDKGEACNGYALVRGIDPAATGELNDILAFAKEDHATGNIIQVALARVDGRKVLPGRWYGVNLKERQVSLI